MSKKLSKSTLFLIPPALIIISLAIIFLVFSKKNEPSTYTFGVSFSKTYADGLGLNWQETYIRILDELKVKNLRIPTYWKEIEAEPNKFDFTNVDFMLDQAQKRGAKVLLVVGIKQPRWPECQAPDWAHDLPLTLRQAKTLELIEVVVKRYKDNESIWGWQVENEPFFRFGKNCDQPDKEFLKKEVELVKKLDPIRPVVITDTGELATWITPMQLSDIFGTTLYKTVYDKLLGYFEYPWPNYFYIIKSNFVRSIFAPNNRKTIISELQAEPWSPIALQHTDLKKQMKIFSADKFRKNIEFARSTGFDEIYLWGVEWWFFMEEKNHPEYLDYARTLF